MAEYIDKNALYKKIAELEELARDRYLDTPSNSPAYPRYMAQMNERTNLKHMVADFPATDVAPVVHGFWMNAYKDFKTAECSRCKSQYEVTFEGESNGALWDGFIQFYKHCPNCGAKMDLKE